MTAHLDITNDLRMTEWVGDRPYTDCLDEDGTTDILIFTIHDGAQVPADLFGERTAEVMASPEAAQAYVRERDWGANLVAQSIAEELGTGGYLRVNLARVVMDFGRFPGSSDSNDDYLRRYAIYPPFSEMLEEEKKHEILARYYDGISQDFTQKMAASRITLGIHTYDPLNSSGTERPQVSLVSRLLEYQIDSTVPPGVFDPLFPPILCEATSHRALSFEILNRMEHGGFQSALNYPYVMPVGSLEIRAQVWFFFRHVRERFHELHPETRDDPAYQRVWQMLLDTNRRSADAQRMRGYLHRYREASHGQENLFKQARRAYQAIRHELLEHHHEWVDGYRHAIHRPDNLGIEVRKDLLFDIDSEQASARPLENAEQTAREISRHVATAVDSYLKSRAVPRERLPLRPVPRAATQESLTS